MMKILARNTLIIIATLAVIGTLWLFRNAVLLFVLSVILAASTRPVVSRLVDDGMKRSLAIILTYLVVIAILVGLFAVILPSLLAELQRLSDQFVVFYNRIWTEWPRGSQIQQMIISRLPPAEDLFNVLSIGETNSALSAVLAFASGSVSTLGQLAIALVLSIYWTADRVRFERLWLSLLPAEDRMRARGLWRDVEDGIGAYVRSELVQALVAGVVFGIGFTLIGLPYPILLALVGAVAWTIPWMGLVVTLPWVILAGLSVSLGTAALAGVFTLAVLLILELVVEPKLVNRERFSPLLNLLMVIALGSSFGLIGIIVAPPLAVILQLVVRHLFVRPPAVIATESLQQIVALNQHLELLQSKLDQVPEERAQPLLNISQRLESLIQRAQELVDTDSSPSPVRMIPPGLRSMKK